MKLSKRITLTIIALLGFITSVKLTVIYFDVNFNPYALSSFCSINDFIDCDSVAKTTESQFLGIPLAYWGMFLYLFIIMLLFADKLKNIKFVALRYFNAVGYDADGDIRGKEINSQNLLPIIMEVLSGKRSELKIFGNDYPTPDGTCIRDYIHVSDLASAHVLALEKLAQGMASQSLNLGTGKGTSVKEMVEAVEKVCGRKVPVVYAPRRAGDPAVLIAAADKARALLGWKPAYTDICKIVQTVYNIN